MSHEHESHRSSGAHGEDVLSALEQLLDARISAHDHDEQLLSTHSNLDTHSCSDAHAGVRGAPTPSAGPATTLVEHTARPMTLGDLRRATVGLPDDMPLLADVALDPGSIDLHRHVVLSAGHATAELADGEELIEPVIALRTDFPTGTYEVPADLARRDTGDDAGLDAGLDAGHEPR
ncbi:DUF6225 family protein [Kineococcus indalonis]|uniref:DUF6225 family protein n=1 Tax=Kineococcus indalonis TaxID=2696566 RepID=UPI0014124571|nr:DUF6225 family protein [Kineococcus indalonis]NAZ86464.1 hypothetical protein [Kineococcus indalonis]